MSKNWSCRVSAERIYNGKIQKNRYTYFGRRRTRYERGYQSYRKEGTFRRNRRAPRGIRPRIAFRPRISCVRRPPVQQSDGMPGDLSIYKQSAVSYAVLPSGIGGPAALYPSLCLTHSRCHLPIDKKRLPHALVQQFLKAYGTRLICGIACPLKSGRCDTPPHRGSPA